jgi:hypothetical protein
MRVKHLGKHGSDGLDIDPDTPGDQAIHALQLRSPSEQFAIDVADALEETLQPLIVGQGLRDLCTELLGNVLLLWSLTGIADGEVVLGTMPRPFDALAARFPTAEEPFDQRAAKDAWVDGSYPGEQGGSSSAERSGWLPL